MAKAEGIPFKIVEESAYETMNVTATPRKIENRSQRAVVPASPVRKTDAFKNKEYTRIIAGNLPLHGTKVLVISAINLSRRINDSTGNYTCCIASESHAHCQSLLAMAPYTLEECI